ncbi:hypothetical protein SLITO_v1c10180 [Spiroplasma litorale]|uniref:Uncharacterized protein n=1 Tax=Spiroplasma litorale TaxID=216942 RepID=A0A0K1W2S8_9MOLU|nr:YwaF family protein [Spiroplasma litorale]AKX34629.1 hypothetical protein SLITO_v1c10180 [Spiroplasma litorale]
MLENLSWVIAIFLAVGAWASLSIFTNYYNKEKVYLAIRISLITFLLFTQIQRTVYLGPIHQAEYARDPESGAFIGQQWYKNPVNYFLLYFCTISAWTMIIILIYPNKQIMECFFPYMIMGPIVTFIFPTEKPLFWTSNFVNWFTFFFGHAFTLFGTMYVYLYGYTGYKFGKKAIYKSVITGLMTLSMVELYNLYFRTNFIMGEVAGAFNLHWSRPILFVFILAAGSIYISIGLSFAYFFKPIYDKEQKVKLHNTWWDNLLINIKKIKNKKQ